MCIFIDVKIEVGDIFDVVEIFGEVEKVVEGGEVIDFMEVLCVSVVCFKEEWVKNVG